MINIKNIISEIDNIFQVKGLIEVYEEISATKMRAIRDSVTASEAYFAGLAQLSDEVALDLTFYYQGKNKEAAVFLSADTGLYGDLIDKILISFVDFVKSKKIDAFVVGKLGVSLMSSYAPEVKFKSIDIKGDAEDLGNEGLKLIMESFSEYNKINVFHGRFESIARQGVVGSTISGPEIEKYGGSKDEKETNQKRFVNIYEPTMEVVGTKFGKEISASIFDASMKENQLAKYAARLMHLDSAINNIDKKLIGLDNDKKRMRKKIEQKKQTERIARWQKI